MRNSIVIGGIILFISIVVGMFYTSYKMSETSGDRITGTVTGKVTRQYRLVFGEQDIQVDKNAMLAVSLGDCVSIQTRSFVPDTIMKLDPNDPRCGRYKLILR